MATSGTYAWAPTVTDMIVDAFARAGLDEGEINPEKYARARFHFNLMMVEWQNKGVKQWLIEERSITLTDGDATPSVDTRMIDILDMVLRRSGVDTPVHPVSRKDYLEIPDKTKEGRPDRFWVDRQQGGPVLTLWPVPENSTDVIIFNQLRRAQDIQEQNAAVSTENPDVPYLWTDATIAGLAYRMAGIYAPKREDSLKGKYTEAFKLAESEGRERGSVQIAVSYAR